VEVQPKGIPSGGGWTIDATEELLRSLPGVMSVRVVGRPGAKIDEVHLLTDQTVSPKQTVRNVESALLARFDLTVDHRKVSVAQTDEERVAARQIPVQLHVEAPSSGTRFLLLGHTVDSERSHRVRVQVSVEWNGETYTGQSSGADLPRPRLEALAGATLAAIEAAVRAEAEEDDKPGVALSLDGVKTVDAFDRKFVLVAVHALHGREITGLEGASAIEDSADRSVVMATLQATDRWIRGRV
jgi:hypothetical protein